MIDLKKIKYLLLSKGKVSSMSISNGVVFLVEKGCVETVRIEATSIRHFWHSISEFGYGMSTICFGTDKQTYFYRSKGDLRDVYLALSRTITHEQIEKMKKHLLVKLTVNMYGLCILFSILAYLSYLFLALGIGILSIVNLYGYLIQFRQYNECLRRADG